MTSNLQRPSLSSVLVDSQSYSCLIYLSTSFESSDSFLIGKNEGIDSSNAIYRFDGTWLCRNPLSKEEDARLAILAAL